MIGRFNRTYKVLVKKKYSIFISSFLQSVLNFSKNFALTVKFKFVLLKAFSIFSSVKYFETKLLYSIIYS